MIQQLKKIAEQHKNNPEEFFNSFFELYEPKFFSKDTLLEGLAEFSSPIKEIIAAHQAWGMIGSDGFENYLAQVDKQFDEYVRLGLCFLGKEQCYQGLLEARDLFKQNDDEIPEDDEPRLFFLFYEPLEDFESIAGSYLLEHLQHCQ
jgi:hypothetical protein